MFKAVASGLHRFGVWTVLLGSAILFGSGAAGKIRDAELRDAARASLVYASTALGLAINTRKQKA